MTSTRLSRRTFLNRTAIAGAAAIGAPSLLASCGNDDDGGGEGEGGVSTVVIWDREGAESAATAKFLDKWNKGEGAELGVKADYKPQAKDKYEDILRTAFQTQRGPDIFHSPSAQIGTMVAAGWIQPLKGLIEDDILKTAEPYLGDTSELVWGGEAYAVPTTTFTVRLTINRGLFEDAGLDPDSPPTTFSEVEEAARAITATKNGVYGIALPTAWVGFLNWIVELPILSTNEELTQTGLFNMSSGKFETENYEPVIQHYRTLIQEKIAFPGSESLDADPLLGAYAEGKIGMYISSGSIVGSIRNLNTKIEIGVGPIPIPDGASQVQSPMNAGFPYAISSKVKDAEAAAAAFKAIVSADKQEAVAVGGVPPLSEGAWESPQVADDEWLQLYRPTDLDQQWPKKPGAVLTVEGEDATTTVTKLILDPKADVAPTLADLSERYQTAYEAAVENEELDPGEFGA